MSNSHRRDKTKQLSGGASSGEGIQRDRALCDNFLKLCMLLGMDITFLKTTTPKLGETPGGRYAKKNPRWSPLETEKPISRLLLRAKPIVIPLFWVFQVEKLVSEVILKFQFTFHE